MILKEFERILAQGGVRVVSFDVFDTLVVREHAWPEAVFWQVEDDLLAAGDVTHAGHAGRRVQAERAARMRASDSEEIRFLDMQTDLTQDCMQRELEVEALTCRVNPEMHACYLRALESGCTVIAVSDMYLDKATIGSILLAAGYDRLDAVHVSSETGRTKASGSMFSWLLAEYDIAPGQWLHVGDNPVSDVQRPRMQGIQALHYVPPLERLQARADFNPALLQVLRTLGAEGGLVAGLLSGNWDRVQSRPYWYRFGYCYSGPVLVAFAAWLKQQGQARDLSHLFFMSRDGDLMLKGFKLLFPESAGSYLYASRRMLFFASFTALDDGVLDYLCAGLPSTSAGEYFDRLGLDSRQAEAIFARYFPDPDSAIYSAAQRERLRQAFRDLEPFILEEAERERRSLSVYLAEQGVATAEPGSIGYVDIGWAASSQKFLERITGVRQHGLYLGTHARVYDSDWVSGFLFDRGQPQATVDRLFRCVEIAELLFAGLHASVRRMQLDEDGRVGPQFAAESPEENLRLQIAEQIHAGALDFARDGKEVFERHGCWPGKDLANGVLGALICSPSAEDVEHVGMVPHNAGIGASGYAPIIDFPFGREASLRACTSLVWNALARDRYPHIFWPDGLNRYFSLMGRRALLSRSALFAIRRIPLLRSAGGLGAVRLVGSGLMRRLRGLSHGQTGTLLHAAGRWVATEGNLQEWVFLPAGHRLAGFAAVHNRRVAFDPGTGELRLRRSGRLRLAGQIYLGGPVMGRVCLYRLDAGGVVHFVAVLAHRDCRALGEGAEAFSVEVAVARGDRFFMAPPLGSHEYAAQAQVFFGRGHTFFNAEVS